MTYTLSYSQAVDGWVSFYSYNPDWMIGMNNYFYTFKGGNIYRHNVSETRNTFYQPWWTQIGLPEGSFTPSTLKSVFNQVPLENKLFKTLSLEGDSRWSAALETDLQYSGYIEAPWFEKKEASFFAFVRNNTIGQLALRSLNGIGNSYQRTIGTGTATIKFSISPKLIQIGSILSVGDYLYIGTTPQLVGRVFSIQVNYPIGLNQLVINTAIPGVVPIPSDVEFYFYIKNSVAESHGVLGHYMVFNLENDSTEKIELFAVESNVMKSFP
jgi:hypothetical protein